MLVSLLFLHLTCCLSRLDIAPEKRPVPNLPWRENDDTDAYHLIINTPYLFKSGSITNAPAPSLKPDDIGMVCFCTYSLQLIVYPVMQTQSNSAHARLAVLPRKKDTSRLVCHSVACKYDCTRDQIQELMCSPRFVIPNIYIKPSPSRLTFLPFRSTCQISEMVMELLCTLGTTNRSWLMVQLLQPKSY
jgi:hypothetical protein